MPGDRFEDLDLRFGCQDLDPPNSGFRVQGVRAPMGLSYGPFGSNGLP